MRGPTAYFLFSDEQRAICKAELEAQGGKHGVAQVAKLVGQKWAALSDEEKQQYKERAQRLQGQFLPGTRGRRRQGAPAAASYLAWRQPTAVCSAAPRALTKFPTPSHVPFAQRKRRQQQPKSSRSLVAARPGLRQKTAAQRQQHRQVVRRHHPLASQQGWSSAS